MDTMVALAQQISSGKARLKHLIPDVSSPHSQTKRPHSPLSEDEKDAFGATSSSISGDDRHTKRKKRDISMTNQSSTSDSSLTKPIITNPMQRPHVIAEKGDGLVFTERVTDTSLHDSNKMILKFSQSTDPGSSESIEHDMDMPNIFANSVDTFMKVRYIEKIAKCRVCGFSTPVDTISNMEILKSHVMEHSLKELIQAGCGVKRLIKTTK